MGANSANTGLQFAFNLATTHDTGITHCFFPHCIVTMSTILRTLRNLRRIGFKVR